MSPERQLREIPERVRTSAGFAKGERKRLGEARKIDLQTERIMRFAIPTRETVLGMVDLRTSANHELNSLITEEKYRETLIEFIDARISAANGDRTLINKFIARATPKSKKFDPEFSLRADSLIVHFHIALDCFPKKSK